MLCRIILILITPNLQLDTLLFQLHTLSFFLSPSLLGFISACSSQFQCSKPRDIDPSRSLRFWYSAGVFQLRVHLDTCIESVSEGRAVVIDFVGQVRSIYFWRPESTAPIVLMYYASPAYKPSKIHLLLLDALILFLQNAAYYNSYETSLFL